jgi:hypothetical protein
MQQSPLALLRTQAGPNPDRALSHLPAASTLNSESAGRVPLPTCLEKLLTSTHRARPAALSPRQHGSTASPLI